MDNYKPMNPDILEEENNQALILQTGIETFVECKFMWWLNKDTIEVQPLNGIILIPIPRKHFNKLFLPL